MKQDDIIIYAIVGLVLMTIYIRLVYSIGRTLQHQRIMIRLLQGIAIKLKVDEKYLYTKTEISMEYPNEKKG